MYGDLADWRVSEDGGPTTRELVLARSAAFPRRSCSLEALVSRAFTNRSHSPFRESQAVGPERGGACDAIGACCSSRKALPGRYATDPPAAREGVAMSFKTTTYTLRDLLGEGAFKLHDLFPRAGGAVHRSCGHSPKPLPSPPRRGTGPSAGETYSSAQKRLETLLRRTGDRHNRNGRGFWR